MGRLGFGRRDQFGSAALDRRGSVRVGCRDLGERRGQRADGGGVLLAGLPEAGPRALSISAYWLGALVSPCAAGVPGHQAGQPVPSAFQAALGAGGKVGLFIGRAK